MALPLLELGPLILYAIGLALCLAVVYFSKAFFGVAGSVLGKLPIVGGWIDATAHHIESRITNVFGDLASRFEARVGAAWHAAARQVDRLGHEIAAHGDLLTLLADLGSRNLTLKDFRTVVHDLRRYIGGVAAIGAGIGADLLPRVKGIERGIGEDVLPRVKELERTVHKDLVRERARARAAERTAEREITNLWKWTHAHTLKAGTLAFTGAVAFALARLGLGWLRCPTAKSVFKKHGCSLWSKLDGLIGLLAEAALVTNICTVLPFLEEAFSKVASPLISTLTDVGAGLCSAGSSPPELLPTIGLHLPASPSATLYIP